MKTAWFQSMVSRWQPDEETGAYFIDRNPLFMSIILDYMRTGSWQLDTFDKRKFSDLEEELGYYCIEEIPRPSPAPVPVILPGWNSARLCANVSLSQNNTVATKTGGTDGSRDAAVIGSVAVTYAKMKVLTAPGSTSIGLAPAELNINGGNESKCGYYVACDNGNLYQGDKSFHNGAIPVGSIVEFMYDKAAGKISIKAGSQSSFSEAFSGVSGDLYPAVDFQRPGSSIELLEVRS